LYPRTSNQFPFLFCLLRFAVFKRRKIATRQSAANANKALIVCVPVCFISSASILLREFPLFSQEERGAGSCYPLIAPGYINLGLGGVRWVFQPVFSALSSYHLFYLTSRCAGVGAIAYLISRAFPSIPHRPETSVEGVQCIHNSILSPEAQGGAQVCWAAREHKATEGAFIGSPARLDKQDARLPANHHIISFTNSSLP